ncbi:TPA: hypothetical protein ACKP2K_004932 [Serratia marcescens]
MNNNDKPTIRHFDDIPFTADVSAHEGNMIVFGRTDAGKTGLLQSIVSEYSADAVRQGISIAPTPPSEDEIVGEYSADAVRQGISIAPTPPSEDEAKS